MSTEVVNPILPEFIDKLDPQFVDIYNRYQGTFEATRVRSEVMFTLGVASNLRADQVTIEEYRANPTKYTLSIAPGPKPETGSAVVHKLKVDHPDGEIKVKVYTPTNDAVQAGEMKSSAGLPTHVNYHGGQS